MKHNISVSDEKGMTKRGIIICLVAIGITAFILRTVYPFHIVFGNFVNFLETDAWNRMLYAQQISAMPFLDSVTFTIQNNMLFSFIIGTLGRGLPIEIVGAWLPPILAVGVVVTVYFIGTALFNSKVGLLSAVFVAVIPSEFMHRSLLGFTDHHVLEVLLMALLILFLIRAVQVNQIFSRWSILAGISIFLFMANWMSGIYMIGGLFILFLPVLLIWNVKRKEHRYAHALALGLPLVVAMAVYLPLGGYKELLFLIPGNQGIETQTAKEITETVLANPGTRTISELMPLFFPAGYFNLGVVLTNLHLFAIATLIGLPFLWFYRKDKAVLVFTIWTLVMLVITLNERRFLYYLTLPIGIISALAVYEIGRRLKGKPLQNALILALPLIIISLPLDKSMAESPRGTMSQDWHNALIWLKEQPGDGNVSAWGDYGHWIQYVSGKQPNYFPGPGGDMVAKLFLSTTDGQAKELLDSMNTDYLIVDEATLTTKYGALIVYAGKEVIPKSAGLAERLYFQNHVPGYLNLVYENGSLKIFKYDSQVK